MNLRRKRLRLMRDTQWRGYARTAEGNPITLSQVRSVLSLSVLGNSSQSGAPSPDNPVEVVGTGERTGNLFDAEKFKELCLTNVANTTVREINCKQCVVNVAGSFADSWTGNKYNGLLDNIDKNTVHSISVKAIALTDNPTTILLGFIYDDGTHSSVQKVLNREGFTELVLTSTIGKKIKTISFSYGYSYSVGIDISALLVEGAYTAENMPPYEPYGYKVAVTASGRNLFDAENIIENTEDTTVKIEEYQGKKCLTWTDGGNTREQRFMQGKFKENTQYTFRFSGYSKNNMQIFIVYTDGSYRGMTIQGGEEWNEIIFKSTSGKSIDYWCGWNNYSQKVAIDIDSATIIEGAYTADTMPPYEPYKPPQSFNVYSPEVLHGVGDAHDTVILDFDRRKARFIKNISNTMVNKVYGVSSAGSTDGNLSLFNAFISRKLINNSRILQLMCDRIKASTYSDYFSALTKSNELITANIANTTLFFKILTERIGGDSVEAINTWLVSNPLTIYYILATPTTTDITALQDWDALPQLRGTWILTASGGTEPTLRAEYYSEERSTE